MSKKEGLLTIGPLTLDMLLGSKMVQEYIHRKARYGTQKLYYWLQMCYGNMRPLISFATLGVQTFAYLNKGCITTQRPCHLH